MSFNLKIYSLVGEQSRLVSEVQPGYVLEALPGAKATALSWGSEPIKESPTCVFGYVQGMMKGDDLQQSFGYSHIMAVQPIVPISDHYGVKETASLGDWSPKGKGVYLVIGEITDINSGNFQDELSDLLVDGSVILTPSDFREVRGSLVRFSAERGRKDYVYRDTCGNSVPLSELLLHLKEM